MAFMDSATNISLRNKTAVGCNQLSMLLPDIEKFLLEVLHLCFLPSLLLLLGIDVVVKMCQTQMKLLVGVWKIGMRVTEGMPSMRLTRNFLQIQLCLVEVCLESRLLFL